MADGGYTDICCRCTAGTGVSTGQESRVGPLSLSDLLPPTDDYMTYDGSMTRPGCHETITWIVMNKPIYVTVEQVRAAPFTSLLLLLLLLLNPPIHSIFFTYIHTYVKCYSAQ